MQETKIIISYIVICLTYSLCRLHFLLTTKSNDEFNEMLDELISVSANRQQVINMLIILQALLSPLIAPFSIIKLFFKHIFKL